MRVNTRRNKNISPNVGLEPTTPRLRVSCSTDWASRAVWDQNYIGVWFMLKLEGTRNQLKLYFIFSTFCSYIFSKYRRNQKSNFKSKLDKLKSTLLYFFHILLVYIFKILFSPMVYLYLKCITFVNDIVTGHTAMKTPVLIRSLKLSMARLG